MVQSDDAAKKTADGKKKADAEAKKKADEEAKAKAAEPTKVRVICEATLGHLLLKKGDTTNDPEYVALLKTKRGKRLVEAVK